MPDFTDIETRIQQKYPNVDLTYKWNWPPKNQKILEFYGEPINGLTEEEFTVKLFQKFHNALTQAGGNQGRVIEIINLIVYDWGGIHGNDDNTLNNYAQNLINGTLENVTNFTGIASKSKILAAWNPENYFIYDARVAIALQKLYFNEYRFNIPRPQTYSNTGIRNLIDDLEKSQGEPVDYLGFCRSLRTTGRGSELEKELFMLGKYIQDQA